MTGNKKAVMRALFLLCKFMKNMFVWHFAVVVILVNVLALLSMY